MLKLNFNLRHQAITLLNPGTIVATDSKNYLVANFNFISDDWEYPLTAVFTSDVEKIPYTILVGQSEELEENECFIPWEVLQSSGNVYVSVFCGDLHTTNTVKFKVVKSGYTEGEIPPPPTPTIYEQILRALDSKQPMLTAGENITIEDNVISGEPGRLGFQGSGGLESYPILDKVGWYFSKNFFDVTYYGQPYGHYIYPGECLFTAPVSAYTFGNISGVNQALINRVFIIGDNNPSFLPPNSKNGQFLSLRSNNSYRTQIIITTDNKVYLRRAETTDTTHNWQELTGGGSQIDSGVVNVNGTITFTDSEGNSFTTSGESVIGPQGEPGQDYVLTAQDKDDIADIVMRELPNADTTLFPLEVSDNESSN